MTRNEFLIYPSLLDQNFHNAIEKGDVAAGGDREPIIGYIRAEESAAESGWHPVTLHAWLTIRVNQHDFGAEFFGFVQIFCGDRLIVGRIRAEENHEVSAVPVFIATGRCS